MRSTFLSAALLIFLTASAAGAQTITSAPAVEETKLANPAEVTRLAPAAEIPGANPTEKPEISEKTKIGDEPVEPPYKYVPPTKSSRFRHYLNDAVGPFALMTEAASAGVTTARNAPKEWGGKWEGFGRRFASNMGKNVIKQTTAYALDEALKVDSRFYRSRDRSVAARLRNAVFSSVTARNRKGKRVIGIPKITGSVLANVTAAEVWYPGRYNYVHGLKGGAIGLGLDVGLNIIKEFVWK